MSCKQKRLVLEFIGVPEETKEALSGLKEDDIANFIADNFGISYYDIHYIDDIAWDESSQTFFIKFQVIDASSFLTRFVEARFTNNHLVPANGAVMSAQEGLARFKMKQPAAKHRQLVICWK